MGWVLYLEGATDLAILLALARRLDHPAVELLEAPYVHYVANQPRKAREHFHRLREAKPDLRGIAIYDRLHPPPQTDPNLPQLMWQQREIENYLCSREVLLDFAHSEGIRHGGALFAPIWRSYMAECIEEIERALYTLGRPSPWGPDIKATHDFLDRLFRRFYEQSNSPALIRKTNYHRLAEFLNAENIDPEVVEKLDAIVDSDRRVREGAC